MGVSTPNHQAKHLKPTKHQKVGEQNAADENEQEAAKKRG